MRIQRTINWNEEPEDEGGTLLFSVAPFSIMFDEFWGRDNSRDMELFAIARELVADGHTEAGVSVAQSALEISAEWALQMALRMTVPEAVVDPLFNVIPDRTFMSRRTRTIWAALTDDTINELPTWKAYHAHIERRNRVVHTGFRPTAEDARRSVDVCEHVAKHLEHVIFTLAGIFDEKPEPDDL